MRQHPRQRGFSIIEVIFVLALGMSIIAGVFSFYSQTRFTSRVYDLSQMISSVGLGVSEGLRGYGDFRDATNQWVINASLISNSSFVGTDIYHAFDGRMTVSSAPPYDVFTISLNGIHQNACIRLFEQDNQDIAVIDLRAIQVRVNGNPYMPSIEVAPMGSCLNTDANVVEIDFR